MEICSKCGKNLSTALMKDGICVLCETSKQDTVEKLKAKILELEQELQRQRTAVEKNERSVKVAWSDFFSTDSLH